jgi:hypothetical protein
MVGGIVAPSKEAEAAAAESLQQGVIFVLEGAQLEVAKVGKVRNPFRVTCKMSADRYFLILK